MEPRCLYLWIGVSCVAIFCFLPASTPNQVENLAAAGRHHLADCLGSPLATAHRGHIRRIELPCNGVHRQPAVLGPAHQRHDPAALPAHTGVGVGTLAGALMQ